MNNIGLFITTPHAFLILFIIFGRILGMFFIIPIFNQTRMNFLIRNIISWLITIIIYPYIITTYKLPETFSGLFILIILIKEIFIGTIIGYIISLPIWMIESIGNLIDIQRGYQMGTMMNPSTKNNSSIFGQFTSLAFITYFISSDGLIFIMDMIFKSYQLLDPLKITSINNLISADKIIGMFNSYIVFVLLYSFPILLTCLLVDLILGVISSFIPQINITIMAMGLKTPLVTMVLIFYLGTLSHSIIDKFISLKHITDSLIVTK